MSTRAQTSPTLFNLQQQLPSSARNHPGITQGQLAKGPDTCSLPLLATSDTVPSPSSFSNPSTPRCMLRLTPAPHAPISVYSPQRTPPACTLADPQPTGLAHKAGPVTIALVRLNPLSCQAHPVLPEPFSHYPSSSSLLLPLLLPAGSLPPPRPAAKLCSDADLLYSLCLSE